MFSAWNIYGSAMRAQLSSMIVFGCFFVGVICSLNKRCDKASRIIQNYTFASLQFDTFVIFIFSIYLAVKFGGGRYKK